MLITIFIDKLYLEKKHDFYTIAFLYREVGHRFPFSI